MAQRFSNDPTDLVRPYALHVVTIALAVGLSLGSLWVLSTGQYRILAVPLAAAALVGLFWVVPFVNRRTDWLLVPLVLIYLLISCPFLSDEVRGAVHYGFLVLFVAPLLVRVYRSGILGQGTFRLYCVFFGWAFLTILYSLAPVFSLGRLLGACLGFVAIAACVQDVKSIDQARLLILRFVIGCSIVVFLNLIAAFLLPASVTWANPAEGFDPKYLESLHAAGISIQGIVRFRGIFGNPNEVGGLMLLVLGPSLVLWGSMSRSQKVLLASVMVVAVALAVRADSRSPFVGLALGCGLYVLWQYRGRGALWLLAAATAIATVVALRGGLGSYFNRGEVGTLTGRTDVWAFAIQKIWERPFTGYGYDVNGAILNTRYFPIWYGPWDLGPHSSLHDGYLALIVGVGIPAALLWVFIVLRPWVFIFLRKEDPWGLKPMALLIVLPLLVLNLTEVTLSDFSSTETILFGLAWALGERYRQVALARNAARRAKDLEAMPSAAQALLGGAGPLPIANTPT